MNNFRKLILPLAVVLLLTGSAFLSGQTVDLTVDQTNSFINVSVLNAEDMSSISGAGRAILAPVGGPLSTTQIDQLELTMVDGFSISFLLGAVTISVEPGNASVSLVEAGPAGMVDSKGRFDQSGNVFSASGTAVVEGFINETIDLTTIKPVMFDISQAEISIDGTDVTVEFLLDLEFLLEGFGPTPPTLNLSGPIVLTGQLPKTLLLGDVNCDGVVDLLDVAPFIDLVLSNGFSEKADINQDGDVNLLDVQPFVDLVLGN